MRPQYPSLFRFVFWMLAPILSVILLTKLLYGTHLVSLSGAQLVGVFGVLAAGVFSYFKVFSFVP